MLFARRHTKSDPASRPKNAPRAGMAKFATYRVASTKRAPAWRDLIDGEGFGNPSRAAASAARMQAELPHLQLNAKRGFRRTKAMARARQHPFHRARYDFSMIIFYDQSANRCENAERGARA
jgi:hypothetical protein